MMRRRRRSSQHANHERWLVSYADFITLMFAFFVVLFSSSQVDKRKVGRLAQQMQVAFKDMGIFPDANTKYPIPGIDPLNLAGTPSGDATSKSGPEVVPEFGKATVPEPGGVAAIQKELQTELKIQIADKDVSLKVRRDGLVITLHEMGFFDSGSATVKPAALQVLSTIAQDLARHNNPLRIEGHTDNQPIHTSRFDSNWELSTARATEIVKYFIVTRGFPPDRISAAGYAEYHPVAGNETVEGRSQNRRVDIVVLGANAGPLGGPAPSR